MLSTNAIKVYEISDKTENYVTTVFHPKDFVKLRDELLNTINISSVTAKTAKDKVIAKFVLKGVKLRSNHKVVHV